MTFLVLLAVAGLLASVIGSWVLIALVAAVTLPVYLIAAIWNGSGFGSAVVQVFLGITVLQISYSIGMLVQATFSLRGKAPFNFIDLPSRPSRLRFFGVWLPLFAFYDVPCQENGSPWNGVEDPNYRTTILVMGWFNCAISITLGEPRSASAGKIRSTSHLASPIDPAATIESRYLQRRPDTGPRAD